MLLKWRRKLKWLNVHYVNAVLLNMMVGNMNFEFRVV